MQAEKRKYDFKEMRERKKNPKEKRELGRDETRRRKYKTDWKYNKDILKKPERKKEN